LEAHGPLEEDQQSTPLTVKEVFQMVENKNLVGMNTDSTAIQLIIDQTSGLPVPISQYN
jgi:hypothetical protein